jgi:hypothetical protein
VLVDDIIAAIETARDKVMADEVRSMVKLGLPKAMAQQRVNAIFHIKEDEESGTTPDFDGAGKWGDIA